MPYLQSLATKLSEAVDDSDYRAIVFRKRLKEHDLNFLDDTLPLHISAERDNGRAGFLRPS